MSEVERTPMQRVYDDLAKEGGGTWATYMMMDIEAAMASTSVGNAIKHPFNGQRVEKWTGEAQWTGICLATYMTSNDKVRHIVEVEPQGFQMIAVTDQLRIVPN